MLFKKVLYNQRASANAKDRSICPLHNELHIRTKKAIIPKNK